MSERSFGTISKPDGAKNKLFPNGMKASLKALRKYRPQDTQMGVKRDINAFIHENNHLELFNWVAQKYNHKPVTAGGLFSIIEAVESNGEDTSDMNFLLLRFYAEVVKIPVGLLALFTHCVSIEGDPKSTEDVLDVLTGVRDAIDWLIAYKGPKGKGRKKAFHRPREEHPGHYEANIATLYQAAAVYNRNSVKPGLEAHS